MKTVHLILVISLTSLIFLPQLTEAQEMMGQSCPMCETMGRTGMILGVLLALAFIAALVALTIFLIRRSRPST